MVSRGHGREGKAGPKGIFRFGGPGGNQSYLYTLRVPGERPLEGTSLARIPLFNGISHQGGLRSWLMLFTPKGCLRRCAPWFWKPPSLGPLPSRLLGPHQPYLQRTASVSDRASYTHESSSRFPVITTVRPRSRGAITSLIVQPMVTWNRRSLLELLDPLQEAPLPPRTL